MTLPFQANSACGLASARYARLRSTTRPSIPNLQKRIYTTTDLTGEGKIKEVNFHEGDDGNILRSFLTLLPSLLKKDGQAIILNTADALKFINFPNLTTKRDGNNAVYIIRN